MERRRHRRTPAGFTLIELVVVVLIVGVMASVAVPQYFKQVEMGKVAEAKEFIQAASMAQQRYFTKYGGYCMGMPCAGFDLAAPTFKNFNAFGGFVAGTGAPSWKIQLTRNSAPAVYGAYTLTYDWGPGGINFTCSQPNCQTELLP